ncbi:hypothetical protein vseg_012611 [Gypsophila vaccaria]
MATSFHILLCYLLFFFVSSFGHRLSHLPEPSFAIKQACYGTRYPEPCVWSIHRILGSSSEDQKASDIVEAAFSVSAEKLKAAQKLVQAILNASVDNKNKSDVAKACLNGLSISESLTNSVSIALAKNMLRDARTLGSAALTYQYDCLSTLNSFNDTDDVVNTMKFFSTSFIVSTSNALSLLQALDTVGPIVESWTPPRTERDGYWEDDHVTNSGVFIEPMFNLSMFKADVTVCKNVSNGCLSTVQAAVETAPNNLKGERRYVIRIKEGVYNESVRVPYNKTNLLFLGDGIGKTVITAASLNVSIVGATAYESATVGVLGRGFMADGITFENTGGPEMREAVAFRSSSDYTFIQNCEFLGNQGTLYAHSLRQLYKSCRIEGNVDFIFGNAAAVFKNCTILVRPRPVNPDKGENNTISAHGRTDPAQPTGFVFLNSLINGTPDYLKIYLKNSILHRNYLGRPPTMFSRTIYINCTMENIISPEGSTSSDNDLAISTAFFGEFNNSGLRSPGASNNVSIRVPWSYQIPKVFVHIYYVDNFLRGDDSITYTS